MRWPWPRKSRPRSVDARQLPDARLVRALRARFDAAQTTAQNRRHWQGADALSADAAASPAVRKTLRNRARYEIANNCYAKGILLTLAQDLVGAGPRLQMTTGDAKANARIEREFHAWARGVRLAEKLRTMRMARGADGEAFAVLVSNRGSGRPVTLDLRLVEADQVETPNWTPSETQPVDGIVLDRWGNPQTYHLLESHPGGAAMGGAMRYRPISARDVIHWFRADRPGQHRGVSELTPALPLFALMRRYTLATVSAAETAAEWALFIKTTMPPGGEAAGGQTEDEGLGGLTMEIERNLAAFLPEGWEPSQLKAEQPATVYPDFKDAIISEIARCLQVPRNIAALDSSRHSYISGRLDLQGYVRNAQVERSNLDVAVMDRILSAWLAETKLIPGYLPAGRWLEEDDPHQWMWPGIEEIDPRWARVKMDQVRLGHITEAEFHAARGRDWEDEQAQRRREAEARTEKNLPAPGTAPKAEAEPVGAGSASDGSGGTA